MKKLTTMVLALALFASAPAFANGDKTCDTKDGVKGNWETKKIDRMKEKLTLTDDQVAKIQAIHEAQKAKFEALRADTEAQVAAVLTPEQKAKHDEMKKEWKEKRKEHKEKHEEKA